VFQIQLFTSRQRGTGAIAIATLAWMMLLSAAPQAQAHHAMGGGLPTTWWQGLISGLAHPLIGPDHFAFIVAVGLLAATKRQGIWLPLAFLGAALAGSGLHLSGLSFPGLEFCVSASVLMFGILLAMKDRPHLLVTIALGAIAGLFHGYAYAEAIFGAEMTPLLAYLLGFTAIQFVVAMLAWLAGKFVLKSLTEPSTLTLRFAGFVISGAGTAFLSSVVIDAILPQPPA
jgi:urease accessory protein